MFDGIKIVDLSVSTDALLGNNRLTFPLPVDEHTWTVLDQPRRANDQGLTFTLIPTKVGNKVRCELKGSLHRYGRAGRQNYDEFTAFDLLATLDQLVSAYEINPFLSRLNNVEFGVNVRLPFAADFVLNNLISFKYRPFTKEQGDGFAYYQAVTQRYIVKLYNKGEQYGLPGNVLRVEVKVLKMEYLKSKGIRFDMLADLLTPDNYETLGMLLVGIFTEILFDEPTINPAALTSKERDVYQNGRNPRFWSIPDNLEGKEYDRCQKRLKRSELKFRALVDQHGHGNGWQSLTAALIGQTWDRLSRVDNDLLRQISNCRSVWQDLLKYSHDSVNASKQCPLLTGYNDSRLENEMSDINPLSTVLIMDNNSNSENLKQRPKKGLTSAQFFEWQRTHPPFNRMGLSSLTSL